MRMSIVEMWAEEESQTSVEAMDIDACLESSGCLHDVADTRDDSLTRALSSDRQIM